VVIARCAAVGTKRFGRTLKSKAAIDRLDRRWGWKLRRTLEANASAEQSSRKLRLTAAAEGCDRLPTRFAKTL